MGEEDCDHFSVVVVVLLCRSRSDIHKFASFSATLIVPSLPRFLTLSISVLYQGGNGNGGYSLVLFFSQSPALLFSRYLNADGGEQGFGCEVETNSERRIA